MKIQSSKSILLAVALFVAAISFSSCNRGYGCPYELKAPTTIIKLR